MVLQPDCKKLKCPGKRRDSSWEQEDLKCSTNSWLQKALKLHQPTGQQRCSVSQSTLQVTIWSGTSTLREMPFRVSAEAATGYGSKPCSCRSVCCSRAQRAGVRFLALPRLSLAGSCGEPLVCLSEGGGKTPGGGSWDHCTTSEHPSTLGAPNEPYAALQPK